MSVTNNSAPSYIRTGRAFQTDGRDEERAAMRWGEFVLWTEYNPRVGLAVGG